MRTELVIKGNAVYEIDLDCLAGKGNGGLMGTCNGERKEHASNPEKNNVSSPGVYENKMYHRE